MLTPEREKEIRQRIDAIKHYAKTSQLMGSYEETPGPDMEEMLAEIDSLREKLAMAQEQVRCADINLDNLAGQIPGLDQHPFFKIVKLQIEEALSKIRGDK